MSEETKKTPQAEPAAEPKTAEQAAPEAAAEQAAPASETAEPKDAKKDGWFKKNRDLEAAKAKLEAAEQEAAQTKEKLLRMAAEYDNYRKRTAREADQKFNDGISFAVNQIIPILDTLEMAANAPTTDENYKKGVTMTLDKAAKALDVLHVEEIESLGKPFDPNFMNAVQQVPAEEGQESRTRFFPRSDFRNETNFPEKTKVRIPEIPSISHQISPVRFPEDPPPPEEAVPDRSRF